MQRDEIIGKRSVVVSCFWCVKLHRGDHALSVCPECAARYSTIRALEMSGSFALDRDVIDELVTRTSAGNYALGYMDRDGFNVFYVGRSDSDLRQQLHEWVGIPGQYEKYASPAKASWGVHPRPGFPVGAPALARVSSSASAYTRFAYSYAGSASEAYAKEWRNFTDFGGSHGLDNDRAPSWRQ